MLELKQFPTPGKHMLCYCGDTLEIRLSSNIPVTGEAVLCTNFGNATLRYEEVISQAEQKVTIGGQDWRNIRMERVDSTSFLIRLAMIQEGHFECKTCLVTDPGAEPIWTPGDNLHINVEPAAYSSANTVYCAFVRQFGQNKNKAFSSLPEGVEQAGIDQLDAHQYAVVPPSGTFRGLIQELDHIVSNLKCRIIHLLPINITPTVYGRMGRFGSPYASLDFTSIDPSLAEFDRTATPLDQFLELVDAIHRKNAKIIIDIAINHTGWAAKLHEDHPDWLVRNPDGSIHSPGAWGVVWGDLTELDHNQPELWQYLADMFLTWCARGVDGFRCDAGYMIPANAWEYIIARVRMQFPETVFLLEGLGGDPAVTQHLLDNVNMNWAYSELFQNYTRQQIEGYLKYAWEQSASNGILIHYAETHDNSRLAAVSQKYAKMRTMLCALASISGAFGFANGVEWFAKEKIDVHEANALNWGAPENQVSLIARVNTILALHPAFHDGAMPLLLDSGSPNAVLFTRSSADTDQNLLIAVNLDCERGAEIVWNASYTPDDSEIVYDLISGHSVPVLKLPHNGRRIAITGGQVVCLTASHAWLDLISESVTRRELVHEHIEQHEAATMALRILCAKKQSLLLSEEENPMQMASQLRANPEEFLQSLSSDSMESPYVHWQYPSDLKREVMLPPGHMLFVTASERFRFAIRDNGKILSQVNSIPDENGRYFAVLPPLPTPDVHTQLEACICAFEHEKQKRASSALLLLASDLNAVTVYYERNAIFRKSRTFLQANGRGAILHKCMERGRLESRYDAILLANLSPEYPEDRHVMWRRLRLWVTYHARQQEVLSEHIASFHVAEDGGGVWHYEVPVGNGLFIELTVKFRILQGENSVLVSILRRKCGHLHKRLADTDPVRLVIRPDIEDRNFHYSTKASAGPEKEWSDKITTNPKGFVFRPAPNRIFRLFASQGQFRRDDKWTYMIYQGKEAQRGLDPDSDLYSPGAFHVDITGGEFVKLGGQVVTDQNAPYMDITLAQHGDDFTRMNGHIEPAMRYCMQQFIVKRGNLKTVIAGYPWFLDWGRDTLIAARGLIAAPQFREDVKAILLQFASFADRGTIPNMISGANASNRDTSDAPLWLFTACADLCRAEGNHDFLATKVHPSQNLFQVLEGLASGMITGTPNGIQMDPQSALIFSPSHFTWMDTNYPAGTPREGYPIEIQALWFFALSFLAENSTDLQAKDKWGLLAKQVKTSIHKFFVLPAKHYLSDCLHCRKGISAEQAEPDDHLRPNQLFAITLGAVDELPLMQGILRETSELLIPGAIRSLADRKTEYPLPISFDGHILNDPSAPYWGHYEGDEDTRRKPAYHNGTAWTWPFPAYAEAYFMTYGHPGKHTAASLLSTMVLQMDNGCIMQLPEIMDGDYPHVLRGCDAQAWGITEFYRVWKLLHC